MASILTADDTISSTDLIRQKWLDNNFYGGNFSFNFQKEKSDFTLGAGWSKYDGQHFGKIIWAQFMGDTPKDFEWYRGTGIKTDFNVYIKYNYSISEKLSLYADLQYRNILHAIDGIDDDLRDLTQDHNYDFFNPKMGIFYQPTSHSKAYLSWAVGHREPNRSNFTDADPNGKQPTFETMNDFEAGYNVATNRLSVSTNLYFMLYDDQLILTGEINDVGSAIMTNTDKSYRTGIEVMAGAKVLSNLVWDINATLSQNKILNFIEYVDTYDTDWNPIQQTVNKLGSTDIAFSPSIIANSTIMYEPFSGLKFALISQYVGKQFIDNSSSNDRKLDAYFVNNLRVSYSIKPEFISEVEFHLLFSNLFDEKYETNAWVWSYIIDGTRYKMDGYFPQAGTNFMVGVDMKF
jgi:iron complex outermembrane recepter protein